MNECYEVITAYKVVLHDCNMSKNKAWIKRTCHGNEIFLHAFSPVVIHTKYTMENGHRIIHERPESRVRRSQGGGKGGRPPPPIAKKTIL